MPRVMHWGLLLWHVARVTVHLVLRVVVLGRVGHDWPTVVSVAGHRDRLRLGVVPVSGGRGRVARMHVAAVRVHHWLGDWL